MVQLVGEAPGTRGTILYTFSYKLRELVDESFPLEQGT